MENKYLLNKKIFINLESTNNTETLQKGGGGPFFTNDSVLYIMADLHENIKMAYKQRANILLPNWNIPEHKQPHITIFSIHINQNHPSASIFETVEFEQIIRQLYDKWLSPINIITQNDKYEMYGKNKTFFVHEYTPDDKYGIVRFTTGIYNYIDSKLQITPYNKFVLHYLNQSQYYVLSHKNEQLIAVEDIYYGNKDWKPHITVIDSDDMAAFKKSKSSVYQSYYGITTYNRFNGKELKGYDSLISPEDKVAYLTNIIDINRKNINGKNINNVGNILPNGNIGINLGDLKLKYSIIKSSSSTKIGKFI